MTRLASLAGLMRGGAGRANKCNKRVLVIFLGSDQNKQLRCQAAFVELRSQKPRLVVPNI